MPLIKDTARRKLVRFYLWVGLAWAALWMLAYTDNSLDTLLPRIVNEIWRGLYILPINFFVFEYTWPYVRQKRRFLLWNILLALFFLWAFLMLLSFGLFAWRLVGTGLGVYTPLQQADTVSHGVAFQASAGIMSLFFFGVLLHLYHHRQFKNATNQLQLEKQQAELNFLKSQTNPHFLFNTLNNIYSLTRDKSEQGPEAIMQLSKILRFMLFETGGDYITIEQELVIIRDYIELEKLRYDESLRIEITEDLEDRQQQVPPLLLIPLVENAFKHGISETRGRPFIYIHLKVNRQQLEFVVSNSTERQPDEPLKENIGLTNLRRQLELLYTDYRLSVEPGESVFTVTLQINLRSHV